MSKSSIHFREAMPTSEAHNMRQVQLDYNEPSLEVNNESVVYDSIADRLKQVQAHCKKVSGRKLQKNAQVIREAVVNLKPGTTMDDLKELAQELKQEYGINCFQIHIHRDEGHKDPTTGEFKINHHAHMVFDWQDRKKGTVQKLNRMQMSQMQTLVAKVLDMERGELKENSNRERLEPIEFKRVQEEKRYKELQQQNADLEQKKNEVRARIEILERERGSFDDHRGQKEALRERILDFEGIHLELSEKDLTDAISILEDEIERVEREIRNASESK